MKYTKVFLASSGTEPVAAYFSSPDGSSYIDASVDPRSQLEVPEGVVFGVPAAGLTVVGGEHDVAYCGNAGSLLWSGSGSLRYADLVPVVSNQNSQLAVMWFMVGVLCVLLIKSLLDFAGGSK